MKARLFYLYLNGLSLKSRWMTAMAAPLAAAQKETSSTRKTEIIRDKAKAVSILFGPWQKKE